jgi:hypothetical protein
MSGLLDDVDCLEMPDGTWAFTDSAHFRLHWPTPLQGLAFTPGFHPVASGDRTRQLLAAALAAGVARHQPGGAGPSGKPSLPRYIYALASNYHMTHATPFTMRHVGARLRNRGDEALARYFKEVADEETGHDRLVLEDLEALGIRADACRPDRPRFRMHSSTRWQAATATPRRCPDFPGTS